MRINRQDTNGVKPLLQVGELGYDNYPTGGDAGRVYVGNGSENIPQAKKSEVVTVDGKIDTHIGRVDNPHTVTKTQVGLGSVDNTADSAKNVLSATKLTTARAINGVNFDGSTAITVTANTAQSEIIKFDTGTTEGTDLYTFNGSSAKTINIKAGTNVTLTKAAGSVTINANDTSVAIGEVSGLGTGASTFLSAPTSANLAAMLTDETGTGANVFANSPTLVTPVLGVATGTSFNSITGLSSTATDIKINGTQAAGSLVTVARADHVHPIDTSRAASTHTHGNISNTGAIGTTANLPIITGASGVLQAGSFGTAAGTFCQGNDSRLTTNLGIAAGTTAGPIVTSSTGTNATLPTASASASGVVTTGAQDWAGVKTFSTSPIVPTPTTGDNSTKVATTEFVNSEIANDAVLKVSSTDNAIARFDGTSGQVKNSDVVINDLGNVGVGTTPKTSYSPYKSIQLGDSATISGLYESASKGYVLFANCFRNSSNIDEYLTSERVTKLISMNGTTTWLTGPAGTAGTTATLTSKMILDNDGVLTIVSPTGGLGYGTGSGGTVTQLTSKSTSVTLNRPTGQITTHNEALAAGATVVFTVTNTVFDVSKDMVYAIPIGYNNNYDIDCYRSGSANQFQISVRNRTSSSLSDPLVIRFIIIKGAIS